MAKEFIEIGSTPVQGIRLRQVLGNLYIYSSRKKNLFWSPDGMYLAISESNGTVRIWDTQQGKDFRIGKEYGPGRLVLDGSIGGISWAPNGETLVSIFKDERRPDPEFGGGTIFYWLQFWDTKTWRCSEQQFYGEPIETSWSPDGSMIAATSTNGLTLIDFNSKTSLVTQPNKTVAAWSPDGSKLALGPQVEIFNPGANHRERLGGNYSDDVLAWHPNGQMLASGGDTKKISIWDVKRGVLQRTLEGHTAGIQHLFFSFGGQILTSVSENDLKLWDTNSWNNISINNLESVIGKHAAFHPHLPLFASSDGNKTIRLWDIDYATIIRGKFSQESVQYTTAKLVLVGDSGVGKTGLGWRLSHNEFKEHSSTHGQQFWVVPELNKTRADGTECEAVLWDLAGQHIYRSIHSIFLDNVDAAIILFDPTNRQEPLKGVQFWLEQLKGKKNLPPNVLIGARVDRGAPTLSQQELDQFCQKYGISGGYIGTSAKTGEGLRRLIETLKEQIPWDQMTTTVTTVTFKRIKEFVLLLKEKPDRDGVLVRPDELRTHLQATDKNWQFTDAEMMTAVGHLANHGYVTILKSSSGEEYILLVPELLASVAASIFLHADKHPRELGAMNETELLQGKYPIEEFKGLEKEEQQVLLDATVARFLEHSICFRESYGDDNLLIFPSLIKQKRPLKDDILSIDDISYIVRGRVENIYAILVVLLGYTPSFDRINQWQNQAQYETKDGNICGFRLVEDREGEIELILYYGNAMPQESRDDFQALFEQFLYQRDVEVMPFPPVICPNGHRQERATVVKRSQEGKKSIFCDACGAKTELPSMEEVQTIGTSASQWLQVEEAIARLQSAYEAHLVRVKGYRRGWETPRCYISHVPDQMLFAQKLSNDLSNAGIYILEEVSNVVPDDVVIVLDSSAYQKAWQSRAAALQEHAKLIEPRLTSKKLISIAIEGKATDTHDLPSCQPGNFSDMTHYLVGLFDLVLNLFAIPLNHAGFAPLRKSLHEQWERDLAGKKGKDMTAPLKVFISYYHKDEEFKDELVTMLSGLQRRGVIDTWQDRRIEAGDEWYQEIQDAMNDCDLAILLVSANFIASSFIQDEELTKLLKRRMEEGLRVVPIIVKPCMWQSEPTIKDIQVLPRDGKPIITFSKDIGDRDQVWTDIAKAIEKLTK